MTSSVIFVIFVTVVLRYESFCLLGSVVGKMVSHIKVTKKR